jgi:hypothetical protein
MKKVALTLTFALVTLLVFATVSYYFSVTRSYAAELSLYTGSPVPSDSATPEFLVLSPENKTYNTTDIQLSFAVDDLASQIKYVLDEQENMAVAGNTTLTGLTNGVHNITVYACDTEGNIRTSKTIIFQIAKPNPTQTPLNPSTYGSFGPLGGFTVKSPSNTTYDSSTLTIDVSGQVGVGRNLQLSMTYSLDGQESLPFPVVTKQAHDWDPFIGVISGSVTITHLSEGSHSITVSGNLQFNSSPNLAQVTVYFTILPGS